MKLQSVNELKKCISVTNIKIYHNWYALLYAYICIYSIYNRKYKLDAVLSAFYIQIVFIGWLIEIFNGE